uniref:Protein GrpE n=1 Tax=Candidatus Methanogaster sp. ANME-2c ERB4 TaxID=2759911 RepID=A0A7G9YEA8_9EURY|nr:protein GrpE [Methanosarcinales archaeon ANME-2c ERB4]
MSVSESRRGFVLFLSGLALCLIGLALSIIWQLNFSSTLFEIRSAVTLTGIGIFLLFLGINLIFGLKIPYAKFFFFSGVVLSAIAMIAFQAYYPWEWRYPCVTYAVGILSMISSFFANVMQRESGKNSVDAVKTESSLPERTFLPEREFLNLNRELEEKLEIIEMIHYKTRDLLDLPADIKNYHKQIRKMNEDVIDRHDDLINRLYEVIDDCNYILNQSDESVTLPQFAGSASTHLQDILRREGIVPIEVTIGEEKFDPIKHEIKKRVVVDGTEEGTIIRKLREGYTRNSMIVRPAWVEIAVTPHEDNDER